MTENDLLWASRILCMEQGALEEFAKEIVRESHKHIPKLYGGVD